MEKMDEDIPVKYQVKMDKMEEQITKLNVTIKDKNEKILELLSEVEEVKIQVFSRDKMVEIQARQIQDLLVEHKNARMNENDIGVTVQEKESLKEENIRLRA